MKNLTVQALINSQWLDIAELQIMQPEKGAEPTRVFRRQFVLSHATLADSSS